MDYNIRQMSSKDLKIMYKTTDILIHLYEEQSLYLMEDADNKPFMDLQKRLYFYMNVWLAVTNELFIRCAI